MTLVLYSPLNLVVWAPGPGYISSKEKESPWATEVSRKVLNRMLEREKAIKWGSRECSSIQESEVLVVCPGASYHQP